MLIAPHGARWADERPSRQVQVQAVFYATQDDDATTTTTRRPKQAAGRGRGKRSKSREGSKRRGEKAVRGTTRRGCRTKKEDTRLQGKLKPRQGVRGKRNETRLKSSPRRLVCGPFITCAHHLLDARTSWLHSALATGLKRIWRGRALWQLCFKVFAS